jgi:acetylornithine deacetylase/succinyl-diaminopimelate desuccinylase-like protein
MSQYLDYIDANRARYVDELKELVRIPSISAVPERASDVARAAAWLREHLRGIGFETVEVHETDGHPIVYAEWLGAGPGAPTALVYGHYDVQPVDPLELWRHPPFEPVIEGVNLVARGATDDKGQMFTHLKAAEAWLKTAGRLPINVKYVIEGEEEVGSAHLDPWIEANAKRLACDIVVISDGAQFDHGMPAINYGLRGLAYFEIRVDGPAIDLHSGAFGGAVANPCNVLAKLLGDLIDDRGRITIDGFYDNVRPLAPEERGAFAKLPFDAAAFRKSIGIPAETGEEGYTNLERRWCRPTCDVNGLYGGYQGDGAKTVLPAWAGAKLSFRLVPDQTPDAVGELLRRHMATHALPTVRVTVTPLHGGMPVLVPFDGPYIGAARRAIETGFGTAPVLTREGGTIPVVQVFQTVLGAPSLLVGWGQHDDGAHSPNEKFNLDDFHRGIRTGAVLLEELAALRR